MKSTNPLVRAALVQAALFTVIATGHAAEQLVNEATDNIDVPAGGTVWFDSPNTNVPVPLATINSLTPATGLLPGWAHTLYGFTKYDGTSVLEVPAGEKIAGTANLATADAASYYYDNAAASTLDASQSIGLVETTRDFVIANGSTLDVALGGFMFHNNSHWLKNGTGGGFLTSSSGQLNVVANGNATDYQINGIVVKDFDASTPLRLVKSGPDHLNLTAANTYTGGTWINNGRLRAGNLASYGAAGGTVRVTGANSQAALSVAGTYNQSFEIEGNGWNEGDLKRGALRFEATATVNGTLALTGPARITLNSGTTGTITGTLTGGSPLELGLTGDTAARDGTLVLNGSAAAMTGTITVTSGRLNANTALGGSVIVLDEASLGGEGGIAGDYETGGTTASSLHVDGGTAGALAIAGKADLSFGTTNLFTTGVPAAPATSFTAFTYGTLAGPVGNLAVNGLRGGTASDDAANSRVLVNYTPGTLVWTGTANANWTQNADLNFDDGAATSFFTGDHVSFTEAAGEKTVTLVGSLVPSSVTFDHSSDYTVLGVGAGIAGSTGITKNGTGTLTLGGQNSSFTGPVQVNGGILKYTTLWEAFGYSSGITIASGAQVDINGASPNNTGRRYTYTIAGNGPDGLGAITNSSATSPNQGAGVNSIVLTADASIGGNAGRLDIGVPGFTPTITGNGHTLTKVGTSSFGFRADAGGSPVHFVIAGGTTWAENTGNAWGGATGTLRIKNGARAGTYGVLTIPTPVFIEAGGILHNQGGGKGTWTGNVTLEGNATLEANSAIDLMGTVTGAHSLTKTAGQPAYLADPQYTGDTTVSGGILSLGTATLADTSTVSIATADGTVLDLPHGAEDTVKALVIGGVTQAVGTYGSTLSDAEFKDDDRFSGTGKLNVTFGGTPYQAWARENGVGAADSLDDSDGDGIQNGIEFVIGGDPSGGDSSALLPKITTDEDHLYFVFRRTDDSAGYDPYVEYSKTLAADEWDIAEAGEQGVTISEVEIVEGELDEVTVKIPKSLAGPGGKLFARLRVSIP